MRSQGKQSKIKKHILEVDFFSRENTTKYIHDFAYKVKKLLSSPESALLLRDIYNDEFGLSENTLVDSVWGPILYREEASVNDFNNYGNLIDIYLRFDINKFFGLSINDFLQLTRYARNVIIDKAIAHTGRINTELTEIQNNLKANQGGDDDDIL